MKKLLSIALLGFTLLPFTAKADIAPEPGFHYTKGCAFFDNLSEYPAFDVYSTSNWRFGPSAIPAIVSDQIDATVSSQYGCQDSGRPFFAIKQSNQKNIVHKSDDERGDWWDTLPENTKYYINATVTGKTTDYSSQLVQGAMPDSNPAVTFTTTYHIDSLTDTAFTAHVVAEAQYDKTGKLLTQTTNQTTPPTNIAFTAPYILLSGIVIMGAAFLALAWRTMGKK